MTESVEKKVDNLEAKIARLEKEIGTKRRVTLSQIIKRLEYMIAIIEAWRPPMGEIQ